MVELDETPEPDPIFSADRTRSNGVASRLVSGLLLGLLVGAIGTTIHRTIWSGFPTGLALGLALTLCAALLIRAWGGLPALLTYGLGWLIATEALALIGPGGDVIVLDPSANVPIPQAGVIWNYGGIALALLTAALPKRWFRREPDDDDQMTELP